MNEDFLREMEAMGLPTGFSSKRKVGETRKIEIVKPKIVQERGLNYSQVEGVAGVEGVTGVEVVDSTRKVTKTPAENTRDNDDDFSDASSNEDSNPDALPITGQCHMLDHEKPVGALCFDPNCSRFVSGSRDYLCKMWDFHGMTNIMKPFWTFEPAAGNPIREMQFNASGGMLLIAPANSQARLFSRDADDLGIFCKGDPYLKDLRVTKGHTSNLTTCQWHPYDRELFLTAAFDSTIRIWNVEVRDTQRHVIAVKSKWKGGRTPISSARFSRDSKLVVGSGQDGCIRIWDIKSSFNVPRYQLEKAHEDGMHITSSHFSMDGSQLLTRSMDQTVKLWDIRKFREPVHTATDIPTFYEESNAIFSPNERYILAGTSTKDKGVHGSIRIFDRKTLEPVTSIETDCGVLKLSWTPKLNQIFAGCSDGSVQVLYDPERSKGGVLLPLAKGPKKLAADEYDVAL